MGTTRAKSPGELRPLTPTAARRRTFTAMRTNGGIRAFTFTLPAPSVSGDYNGNGVVDAGDYVVWKKHDGLTGGATKAQGDGTGDGNVTIDDYDYWRTRFGNTSGGSGTGGLATTAVPEPNTIVMLLMSLLISASSIARRVRS